MNNVTELGQYPYYEKFNETSKDYLTVFELKTNFLVLRDLIIGYCIVGWGGGERGPWPRAPYQKGPPRAAARRKTKHQYNVNFSKKKNIYLNNDIMTHFNLRIF